jgi:hypothetical protein
MGWSALTAATQGSPAKMAIKQSKRCGVIIGMTGDRNREHGWSIHFRRSTALNQHAVSRS